MPRKLTWLVFHGGDLLDLQVGAHQVAPNAWPEVQRGGRPTGALLGKLRQTHQRGGPPDLSSSVQQTIHQLCKQC